MRKLTSLFLITVCLNNFAQEGKRIVILHTNDMHSRLTGFSPEASYTPLAVNDDKTVGGFARIATIIRNEKAKLPDGTLVIDAGDFLMGTLFHTIETETGFQLPLMKKMGYDIVCLGNHEFELGTPNLTKMVRTSLKNGPLPEILMGNAVTSTTDNSDDDLEALYNEQVIKHTFITEKGGLKIGLFSLMGINAAEVAPSAKPVTFEKQIKYAKKAVAELKARKCDMIICVSHSGVSIDKHGNWAGEDAHLAKKVKGINLIVSAHTHTLLEKPMMINNVPVVQAGEYGMYVGKITMYVKDGEYSLESYELIPVNDKIMGDSEIDNLIKGQEKVITEKILRPFGMDFSTPVAEVPVPLIFDEKADLGKSNMGSLVADAIHYYINRHNSAGADMSMVSAGVIRSDMTPFIQTPPDVFRVVPLGSGKDNIPGYALSRLYITGHEMKNVLGILLAAYKSNSDYYCFYSGIRTEFDPGKGLLKKKVTKIDLIKSDGSTVNVDLSKKNKTLFSITANSYMLEFIGIIKKKSFGLINVVPKDVNGKKVTDMSTAVIDMDEKTNGVQEGKEWLALMEYFRQMKDLNNNGIPDLAKKYYEPVKTLFPVNNQK
jgi:5'-nucleotidase / UDP-sugar diphosphatase